MARRLIWLWVILAAGCWSDDQSGAEVWCDGLCAAVARCGFQAPTCRTTCVRQNAPLNSLSASGAANQKACIAQVSCQALSGDDAAWEQERDACWDQGVMAVAVSDRARRFCPDHTLAWFECGYSGSLDDCEHIYSMWSDAVVERVARCDAKQSCDEVDSCTKSVFDNL